MSYNSNSYGNYRTSFAPADWSALESLWGVEDFVLIGDSSANNLQAQYGALHADFIEGRAGDDVLRGFGGKGTLFGGQGDDLIYGGYGGDLLKGYDDNVIPFMEVMAVIIFSEILERMIFMLGKERIPS